MHQDLSPGIEQEEEESFYTTHRGGKASKKHISKELRRKIFEMKPDSKPEAPQIEEEPAGDQDVMNITFTGNTNVACSQQPGFDINAQD